uniref:Pecanex-like protein n=1 Tax=Caenorhabditis tropicalis TaxID=1561998 RepID=A0A1I7V2H8_9PELO
MRVCSTNSILIGIAIHDLIVFLVVIYDQVEEFWFPMHPEEICLENLTEWIHDLQRDILEQTSYWLGVLLALFRLLIMKLPGSNQTLSHPHSGYIYSFEFTSGISENPVGEDDSGDDRALRHLQRSMCNSRLAQVIPSWTNSI